MGGLARVAKAKQYDGLFTIDTTNGRIFQASLRRRRQIAGPTASLCHAVYIIAGRTVTADALRWSKGQRLVICSNFNTADLNSQAENVSQFHRNHCAGLIQRPNDHA